MEQHNLSGPNPQIALQAKSGKSVYLDMQATTPIDPRVLDAMLPLMTESFGNPHSKTHIYGWETEHMVEQAREVRNWKIRKTFVESSKFDWSRQ